MAQYTDRTRLIQRNDGTLVPFDADFRRQSTAPVISDELTALLQDSAVVAKEDDSLLGVQPHHVVEAVLGDDNDTSIAAQALAALEVTQSAFLDEVEILITTTLAVTQPEDVVASGTISFAVEVTAPGGTPTGTVEVFLGDVVVGTGTLDGDGEATIAVAAGASGIKEFDVQYVGDGTFLESDVETVTVYVGINTTLALESDNETPTDAEEVTFTATLSPTTTGTVTFYVDDVAQTPAVTLVAGVAEFAETFEAQVGVEVYAVYNGSATHQRATSDTLTFTVTEA